MNTNSVQTCKRCLYNIRHPLGLVIDEEGICSGCRVHEEKDSLNWKERWDRLEELVNPYRSRDSRNYDCIVPVSGAGDSFFIVHLVKERLGLNPLLVTYNRYYNTPLGIRNLTQLRRCFNCDILIQNINPLSVKKIIRSTLQEFGNFHWPALAGQSVFPVQTAVSHQIPLIIWGAHQGLEQVGMFSHLHEVEMTRRYRKDHDLMGYEADDLLSVFNTLTEGDIWQYRYPDESDLEGIGVRGLYLGNFVRWDPLEQHRKMTETYGYKSSKTSRTFDVFDHVDDWHYMGIHDYIKQSKHGYGKVLDQACREIRHGRLSRSTGLSLVQHYQREAPNHGELLYEWLGMSQCGFQYILQKHSQKQFAIDKNIAHTEPPLCLEEIGFKSNDTLQRKCAKKTITIGKGYPD